jgi:hypothetical protein
MMPNFDNLAHMDFGPFGINQSSHNLMPSQMSYIMVVKAIISIHPSYNDKIALLKNNGDVNFLLPSFK